MILTPDRRLRVFISSTLDLSEERAAARRSIESLRLTPVMFEAGARPHPPRALYRAYVEQSDVFVGIYSKRYGWTAPGMVVSGLEDEFNLSRNKPRLVYIQVDVEREPKLDEFLHRVREDGLSYKPFGSAGELEALLKDDLIVLLTERFHGADAEASIKERTAAAPLPVPPTAFLGREVEVAEITTQLKGDDVRLLTLIGPGGIGKTRLAIEAARRLATDLPDGTFFVPLASLREPQLIGDTIAAALEVATSDAVPAIPAIKDFIRDGRGLLVLDNFEQVITGAPIVAELLSACARLKIIVTSRAPLRLLGEHEFEVLPLAVPSQVVSSNRLSEYSAIQLFVQSARAVRPNFEIHDESAAAVVEICRQLDGLPLAIELAAAMIRVLTPEMLLDRLRVRLTDLRGGLRDMPRRHQRLNDTIAWSYELLEEPTKELFAQLSVFQGGFTLESAEQVCEIETDLLLGVASLTEQSMLRADVQAEHGARFSMLTMIRQFAWERLQESPQREGVLSRHARAFLRLAEEVDRSGGRHGIALDRMEVELDNMRGTFEWLLERGDVDSVANAIWESWRFWWMRGYLKEGRFWADRCLAASSISQEARARALATKALFAIWSGDYEFAVPAFLEAAKVAREAGDRRSLAYADVGIGLVRALTTSIQEGTDTIRRGIAAFEKIGDEVGRTTGLAAVCWAQAITRQFDESDEIFRQALEGAQKIQSEVDIGTAESALAQFRMSRGDNEGVYELIGASLEHLAGARHIGSTILTLEVIAELGLAADYVGDSVSILGATAAIRSSMGTRVPPPAAARLDRLIEVGRHRLGEDFDSAFERGSSMGFPEAVEHGGALLAALQEPRVERNAS